MSVIKAGDLCPCGSNRDFAACCHRYHSGEAIPETAEALMRSRYSAYVVGNVDYLENTWHPSTRKAFDKQSTQRDMPAIQWQGLKILKCEQGLKDDDRGFVTFDAHYQNADTAYLLHERSRFLKQDGRWFYVDGVTKISQQSKKLTTIGRNQTCPCGSGKKYKRCCGA